MMDIPIQTLVHAAAYTGGAVAMGFGAIGAAIGEGYTAAQANYAVSRNPEISGDIFKMMLVGQAIAESASIFALVVALVLLISEFPSETYVTVAALMGAGLSIGLGAIGSGVGSGLPGGAACIGLARQPAMGNKLTTNMLIGSAICQTPSIFALVISFILMFSDHSKSPISPGWAAMLGAGLAAGLSAIGSGIGGGVVAKSSCEGIARNPEAASPVTNSMILGQAITQTPAILGLLISFLMLFKEFAPSESLAPAAALLSAGLCMGLGAIGPGIGEGIAAGSGVQWIARNVSNAGLITRSMLVGMAVAESTAIYSMVISLVLIFVV